MDYLINRPIGGVVMPEPEIPDESYEALRSVLEYAFETDDECIKRIASPVVAAELRRLAYGFATIDDTDPAGQLLNRADEWEAACRKPS